MNTAEQIVDAYFRLCRDCFTISDRKVIAGNNRQIDILAYQLRDMKAFHIEVGVTHRENWCPTVAQLGAGFEKKFFGMPKERVGGSANTDHAKGKSYFEKIEDTYRHLGLDPATINRVWVCWMVHDGDNSAPFTLSYKSPRIGRTFDIEVISLRDYVIKELEKAIGTSNYDDVILRTLGFIKQRESQQAVAPDEDD